MQFNGNGDGVAEIDMFSGTLPIRAPSELKGVSLLVRCPVVVYTNRVVCVCVCVCVCMCTRTQSVYHMTAGESNNDVLNWSDYPQLL